MKQKTKKIVCMICLLTMLAAGLGMTGCSSDPKEEKNHDQENRYTEEGVTLPKGAGQILDLRAEQADALKILCFDETSMKGAIYQSADLGKTWEKQGSFGKQLPWTKQEMADRQWQAALSADGQVLLWAAENEQNKQAACLINSSAGEIREWKLPGITRASFAPDGDLILQTQKGILQKNDSQSGKKLLEFSMEQEYPNTFAVCGQELYVFTNERCFGFSLKDGREIQVPEIIEKAGASVDNSVNFDSAEPQGFHVKKSRQGEYEVYSMTKEGISCFTAEGKRLLIDGSETCLYTNAAQLHGFAQADREHLFAAADSDNGNCLYAYAYTPNKAREKIELTMYTLTENKVFEKIIALYERAHPSVKINLQVGRTEDKAITASDAIKTLNTDILAGKGPDILCLNDMSVKHFAQSGLLEDLSQEVSEIHKKEGLFTNITGCYETGGKLYAVPTQFSFMCAGGSAKVVKGAASLDSLMDALEAESKDVPALPEYTFNSHVLMLYSAFLTADLAEKKSLSESALQTFYQQIGRLYALYGSKEVLDAPQPMADMGLGKAGYPSPAEYNSSEASAQLCYVKLDVTNDFSVIKALKNQQNIHYKALGKKGKAMFLPYNILGVSSKSQHKKEAKDFAAFVLSSKGQECYYTPGVYSPAAPVNRAMAKELMEDTGSVIMEDVKEETLSREEKKEVLELFESFSQPADTDGLFKDIVMNHLQSYLKGDISLKQAASDAAKRLNLYLAEQE